MLRVLAGSFLSGPGGSVLKLLVPREEKNLKLLMAETRLRRHVPRYHGTVDKDGACILPSFPKPNQGLKTAKQTTGSEVFLAAFEHSRVRTSVTAPCQASEECLKT